VLIDNFKMVEKGRFPREGAGRAADRPPLPGAQPVTQNVADLKAQIAANEKGVQELRKMVAHFGLDVVRPIWATCRTTPRKACAG
jgi:5-oxoprolinase (ATP-hydrolysing)